MRGYPKCGMAALWAGLLVCGLPPLSGCGGSGAATTAPAPDEAQQRLSSLRPMLDAWAASSKGKAAPRGPFPPRASRR